VKGARLPEGRDRRTGQYVAGVFVSTRHFNERICDRSFAFLATFAVSIHPGWYGESIMKQRENRRLNADITL
jgi:hypothetical protein